MDETALRDPFTGLWKFNVERSKLSTPPPRSWLQQIEATHLWLQVEEKIASEDGSTTTVVIRANFDGEDYQVIGSAFADTFAYTRNDRRISGVGKKHTAVSIRETVITSEDHSSMTLTYSIFAAGKEVASGRAVFERV